MEIAIIILILLLAVSFFFNITNLDKLIDLETLELDVEYYKKRYYGRQTFINEQQQIKMGLLIENDKLKAELKESIANREHKAKRINELMKREQNYYILNKGLMIRNSQLKESNNKLINRNAELKQWNDKLCVKIEQYDKTLKAYDRAQGQSTGHCLSGNYKVTIEALNKTKKRK